MAALISSSDGWSHSFGYFLGKAVFLSMVSLLAFIWNRVKNRAKYRELKEQQKQLEHDNWTREQKQQQESLERNKKRQLDEKRRELHEKFTALHRKYADLIQQFYVVAQRKITRDEYGDERWDALYKEIGIVILKIAEREGIRCTELSDIREIYRMADNKIKGHDLLKPPDPLTVPLEYWRLTRFLALSFRERWENGWVECIEQPSFATMTGQEFEAYLMRLLRRLGYKNICGTPTTGDQGADLSAEKDGRDIVIQAKNHRAPVGNAAVQEVRSAVDYYFADEGWVITNSTFTPSARELAQRTRIRLIDGHELTCMIREANWTANPSRQG